jgi:prolipoprotein diacylglyceryltransferase
MAIYKLKYPLYGLIIILSLFIGLLYIFKSLKKDNYYSKKVLLYFFIYISCIFYFAKLFSMFSNKTSFLESGLSSYGGLIGVIISAIIFEKILPLDNKLIKYSIISLPLIYSISKLACFISGCCIGIPYTGPFYVIYKDLSNIKVFPVQLVESITFFIIFILCNKLKNNKYINSLTVIISSLTKFLLDFLRYDHVNSLLTVNQIFSLILILLTLILMIYTNKKMRSTWTISSKVSHF